MMALLKNILKYFGLNLKKPFLSCILHSFGKEELATSQRQAIIKLIEKKKEDKDKRLIQNWRSISLLNVDVKITSKALSKRLKNVLLLLFSDNQSSHVDRRFISEGGRLIVDVLQITDVLKLNGMLVTIDINKLLIQLIIALTLRPRNMYIYVFQALFGFCNF